MPPWKLGLRLTSAAIGETVTAAARSWQRHLPPPPPPPLSPRTRFQPLSAIIITTTATRLTQHFELQTRDASPSRTISVAHAEQNRTNAATVCACLPACLPFHPCIWMEICALTCISRNAKHALARQSLCVDDTLGSTARRTSTQARRRVENDENNTNSDTSRTLLAHFSLSYSCSGSSICLRSHLSSRIFEFPPFEWAFHTHSTIHQRVSARKGGLRRATGGKR